MDQCVRKSYKDMSFDTETNELADLADEAVGDDELCGDFLWEYESDEAKEDGHPWGSRLHERRQDEVGWQVLLCVGMTASIGCVHNSICPRG